MLRIDLSGRHAVVTGGASGIGRAIALCLRECGALVTILDINEAALAEAAATHGFCAEKLDITDGKAVKALAERIDAVRPVDILVTAAGILQRPAPPDRFTDNEWSRVVDTNLKGSYLCCARFGAAMAKRGRGAIVTIASVMGLSSTPLHAYGPAKAGLINLTQGLAAEWARAGVRVNAVAPGFTKTPALDRGLAFKVLDEAQLAASSAQGRLVEAEEIASTVAFLVSDLASAITGATVPVDAGFLVAGSWAAYGGVGA